QPDSVGAGLAEGAQMISPGQELILRGLRMKDGRDTVALFTDPQRVAQVFGADAAFIAIQGRHLFELLQDAVILINPAGGRGVMMTPDQIRAVLARAPARMG
ncbi:MAG TPA: SseB family protein, partial [Brevundimonas sp.]|nr:SseB family protein [Brevundimonas sp.]